MTVSSYANRGSLEPLKLRRYGNPVPSLSKIRKVKRLSREGVGLR